VRASATSSVATANFIASTPVAFFVSSLRCFIQGVAF